MRVLIDTNVIIDALTSREPWNKSAEKIFIMAANRIIDMYITASSATDIYYLVRKYLHSTEQAKQIMMKLYSLVSILPVTEVDCIDALASAVADYENTVAESAATKSNTTKVINLLA